MTYLPRLAPLLAALTLGLAACGGEDEKGEEEELSGDAEAACTAAALEGSPGLPAGFPQLDDVTYTKRSEAGPSTVVDGYYEGELGDAYEEYRSGFESAGYDILFDEKEDHDAEVSWKGGGRSGQVALREECGDEGKIYVHITNRPA
jgi:hypothetical protein